jgi:hypothetical protein
MFSDVAQKIEEAHRRGPGGVVDEAGGILRAVEIEECGELFFDGGDV